MITTCWSENSSLLLKIMNMEMIFFNGYCTLMKSCIFALFRHKLPMTESFNQRNYWFQILHYLYLSMHDGDIDCNQQLLSEDEMSDEADPEKLIQWFWGFRLWFSANQECLIPFIKSLWFKILLNFFHTLLKGFFGLSQERNGWSRHSCTNSLLTWLWNKVFFWDFAHQFLFQKR